MNSKPNFVQKIRSQLNKQLTIRKLFFTVLCIMCLTPFVSPPLALFAGMVTAQFIGHPYPHLNHKATQLLLQFSVVGLGFGMNMHEAMATGKEGFMLTIASIAITLAAGYLIGSYFKIDNKTSYLISIGTAICGGSAIAATAPVIKADEKQISIALGTIFILNAVALFVFPIAGHAFQLSQHQFGMWSAIAIQDTSSVVGAASRYGAEALQTATTVKLTRALWIIPAALLSAKFYGSKGSRIKVPYFIGFFIIAVVLNTYVSYTSLVSPFIVKASKSGLTLTLFLIGSGLSAETLRSTGVKPIVQGVLLWMLISILGLIAVMQFN